MWNRWKWLGWMPKQKALAECHWIFLSAYVMHIRSTATSSLSWLFFLLFGQFIVVPNIHSVCLLQTFLKRACFFEAYFYGRKTWILNCKTPVFGNVMTLRTSFFGSTKTYFYVEGQSQQVLIQVLASASPIIACRQWTYAMQEVHMSAKYYSPTDFFRVSSKET